MPTVYNCKTDGDQYRITKFSDDLEVESSYLLTMSECECPAGHRPSCRHRQMLPKFIQRKAIDTEWFLDFDRGGWVQHSLASQPVEERATQVEPEREVREIAPSPPADDELSSTQSQSPSPIQTYISRLHEIQSRRTTP